MEMSITNEYRGRSIPGLPKTSEIIALCHQNGACNKGMVYSHNGSPTAYIKYGTRDGVPEGEMPTQLHVYNAFRDMKVSGFKVPEIYHAFELKDKAKESVTYIVMEYVHGQTVQAAMKNRSQQEKSHILDQVATAVKQLLKVRPPDDLRLGPVQRGHIHHPLFTEDGACTKYKSVDHLQRHFDKVLKGVKLDKRVDFSNEELCFCYADIAPQNFLITNGNQMCIIDFEHAAFLPAGFMSFVLHSPSGSSFAFVQQISSRVQFPKSGNLDAMSSVAYHFGVRGRSSFGLPCE